MIAIWAGLALGGVVVFTRYHLTPSAAASVSANSPAVAGLDLATGRSTLVITVHPLCPCSRASLRELSEIADRWRGRLTVLVIFSQPAELETDASTGELWRSASAIEGATLLRDPNGAIARGFGAQSSGQTFLYDDLGRLRFSGGITPARGQGGDNAGSAAVNAAMAGGPSASGASVVSHASAPVFGCSLE